MDDVALQDKPFFSGLDVGQSQAYLDSMEETNDVEKRNLDRWCFAEHLDAEELIQVLLEKPFYCQPDRQFNCYRRLYKIRNLPKTYMYSYNMVNFLKSFCKIYTWKISLVIQIQLIYIFFTTGFEQDIVHTSIHEHLLSSP